MTSARNARAKTSAEAKKRRTFTLITARSRLEDCAGPQSETQGLALNRPAIMAEVFSLNAI